MDKVKTYRHYITQIFKRHKSYDSSNDKIKTQLLFDTKRDHYQLNNIGWNGDSHIFGCVVHIDIIKEKIWIQRDNTEGIVDDFVSLGVPKNDIVLAFYPKRFRKYTDFAIE